MMQTNKYQHCRYRLVFNSPAFLGNASQQAQWRTPPIKALLRQWWRVAYAADKNFIVDVTEMRRAEGLLFGHAWLGDDSFERNGKQVQTSARQSTVRIRLDTADSTTANGWPLGSQAGVAPLPTSLDTSYAWFGLAKRAGLPDRSGIQATPAKESIRLLRLAVRGNQASQLRIDEVIALISQFGLLGSRSRGGWGALHIDDVTPLSPTQIQRYTRPLDDCLNSDWPMSLAADQRGPCVWYSKEIFKTWDRAMRFIATERRHIRTSLKGVNGKDLRRALGFASAGRMPSPLRWKIIPNGDALKVCIFAMPHHIPEDSGQRMSASDLHAAWRTVCDTLDAMQNLSPRKP